MIPKSLFAADRRHHTCLHDAREHCRPLQAARRRSLFVFIGTVEGPRAPAVERAKLTAHHSSLGRGREETTVTYAAAKVKGPPHLRRAAGELSRR